MDEPVLTLRVLRAYLKRAAESAWDKLLRYVSGANSSKYQAVIQKKDMGNPTVRQNMAEVIGGEMAAELRESLEKTGNYAKGVARVTIKWGLNEQQVRTLFLDVGAVLGEYVYELPKEKGRVKTMSFAMKLLELARQLKQQIPSFAEIRDRLKERVQESRIKTKQNFLAMLDRVQDWMGLEKALFNFDLKYHGMGTELPEMVLAEGGDVTVGLPPQLNGLGKGRPDSDFDPEQLRKGIAVEMEHTRDPAVAKQIAKDHLVENAKYYDRLEIMEEAFEKRAEAVALRYLKWAGA